MAMAALDLVTVVGALAGQLVNASRSVSAIA